MQHERRQYPRIRRSVQLCLHKKRLLFLRGPENYGELVDVSRSGVRLNTRTELRVRERVTLVLKARSMRHPLEFNGEVVWTRRVATDKGRFLQAGVRFQAVTAEQSSLMFRFAVDHLEE
jgi:hypothetical protein